MKMIKVNRTITATLDETCYVEVPDDYRTMDEVAFGDHVSDSDWIDLEDVVIDVIDSSAWVVVEGEGT